MPQSAYERGRLPVAVRRRADAALPSRRSSVAPRHAGRRPRFINEDEIFDGHRGLRLDPRLACLLHVLAFLLAGVQSFF